MKYLLIIIFCFLTLGYAGTSDFELENHKASDHTFLLTLIIIMGIAIAFWPPNDNNNQQNSVQ